MSIVLSALIHPEGLSKVPRLRFLKTLWDCRHALLKLFTVVLFYVLVTIYYYNVEGWTIENCIYFITFTITTVGYGDVHPSSDSTRMFTVFVILFGLVFIFGIINDFAQYILSCAEQQAAAINNRKEDVDLHTDPYKYVKKRAYSILSIVVLVLLGSLFFWKNEDWTFAQSFYMCIVTTTTVGYGDQAIKYNSSRLFLIFYIPISVCTVAAALGNLAAINFEIAAEQKKLEHLNRQLDFHMIKEMDKDGDGVDKCEFLVAMLVSNGVCDKERDIDPWLKRFEQLDADKSGRLDQNDIETLEKEEEERLVTLRTKMHLSTSSSSKHHGYENV